MSTATEIVDEIHEQIADEAVEAGEQTESAAIPEPKVSKPRVRAVHQCLCQSYEVYDPTDESAVFATGCVQTTGSTFAQGHDARLVSFLVTGVADGYKIRQLVTGEDGKTETVDHDTPADAVLQASVKLAEKANKATLNAQAKVAGAAERKAAREKAKADRIAAKAKAKADAKPAEVTAGPGSEVPVGDQTPLGDGEVRIKVGRWEYNAQLDEDQNATYTDGKGAVKTAVLGSYEVVGV